MAASESGLRSRLAELIRIAKDVKEPVVTGSEYEQTKRVLQSYAEQKAYLKDKLAESKKELERHRAMARRAEIVGEGYVVKGYGLLFPLNDDYDIVKELRDMAESFRTSYGLMMYNHHPERRGQLVLHDYQVKGYALLFPFFLEYNIAKELDSMADSFKAAFGVQLYTGALRSVNDMMFYEDNAAQIKGNKELADRIRESDTTLMLSLAAGASPEGAEPAERRSDELIEPSREEIEQALQEMAQKDTEIRTPSTVAPDYRMPDEPPAPALGTATLPSSRQRIKAGEKKTRAARRTKA